MSDEELIKWIKNGDTIAADTIIKRYYDEIYTFLCRKIGNKIEAQDVAQIVFIKLINNIDSYKEQGKFKNYLFKMAVNASNDYFRKTSNHSSIEEISKLESTDKTPIEKLEHTEKVELIRNGLNSLPDYQRDVIIMNIYHGLKFDDISQIMKSNLSSTKSRYQQGIKKLKIIFKEMY